MLQDRDLCPIIVCGPARSGTTFVHELLAAHPDISISDEFFIYKTPSITSWFQEMNVAFNTLVNRGDWISRKSQIMRTLWFYTSQSHRIEEGMHSRRFGNKTPGAEHYIDFYDDVFENNPPLYVYVLREGEKVFLSVRNTNWGKTAHIKGQLKRYIDSIKAIEAHQQSNPQRVYILQLDRIPPTHEERLKETRNLFIFLGEEVVDEMLPFVEVWRPEHTTQQVRRKDPETIIKQLPDEDLAFLNNHEEYQVIMTKYGYGTS